MYNVKPNMTLNQVHQQMQAEQEELAMLGNFIQTDEGRIWWKTFEEYVSNIRNPQNKEIKELHNQNEEMKNAIEKMSNENLELKQMMIKFIEQNNSENNKKPTQIGAKKNA